MASKSPNQRYTLYETADVNGVKRRFLYQYQGEVLEVRRFFDQSVGCGAFILDCNVPSDIRRHLKIINSSDFDRNHVLGMTDPIWEHMLKDDYMAKVVEFRRIPSAFPERSSVVR